VFESHTSCWTSRFTVAHGGSVKPQVVVSAVITREALHVDPKLRITVDEAAFTSLDSFG